MFKNKAVLEVKAAERVHTFMCESNSPLGEVFDALSTMRSFVLEQMNKAAEEKPEECSVECEKKCEEEKPEEQKEGE